MNIYKKCIALFLITAPTVQFLCAAQEPTTIEYTTQHVSTVLQNVQAVPTSMTDLSGSDVFLIGTNALMGAVVGQFVTRAGRTILNPRGPVNSDNVFDPSSWSTGVKAGSLLGGVIGAVGCSHFVGLKTIAQMINQPLLVITLSSSVPAELTKALDTLFISHRFPRAAAFNELDTLRQQLSDILSRFEKLRGKPAYDQAKLLIPAILTFSTAVKDAMLVVKNDPRWFEECNASTLAMTQANIQSYQNAQLATSVIQLAHQR